METMLETPESGPSVSEQAVLEQEFGELLQTTLRLEYELEAAVLNRDVDFD